VTTSTLRGFHSAPDPDHCGRGFSLRPDVRHIVKVVSDSAREGVDGPEFSEDSQCPSPPNTLIFLGARHQPYGIIKLFLIKTGLTLEHEC